ncbi:MAG: hypothetical protein COV35_03010 [Alphaproteobacteria bacterium CG11_big_fil_rev_8_21_14_0_20_39_49]|nr:MAG: hypothetical protein COV35_03010 [Alphaproteobacteria bacterium CG11_big_fil_rev_8_21_14_0_20_39_49]
MDIMILQMRDSELRRNGATPLKTVLENKNLDPDYFMEFLDSRRISNNELARAYGKNFGQFQKNDRMSSRFKEQGEECDTLINKLKDDFSGDEPKLGYLDFQGDRDGVMSKDQIMISNAYEALNRRRSSLQSKGIDENTPILDIIRDSGASADSLKSSLSEKQDSVRSQMKDARELTDVLYLGSEYRVIQALSKTIDTQDQTVTYRTIARDVNHWSPPLVEEIIDNAVRKDLANYKDGDSKKKWADDYQNQKRSAGSQQGL